MIEEGVMEEGRGDQEGGKDDGGGVMEEGEDGEDGGRGQWRIGRE